MIFEAVWWVFSSLLKFLIGLIPSWTPPVWVTTATDTMADAVGNIAMLNGWLPIAAIGDVVVFTLAAGAVAMAVKVGRMVLSLFTGGGGSAA